MLARMRERAADEKGFNLLELLVVTAIVGILAALAIPSFLNQRGKADDADAKAIAHTAQLAEETAFTDGQAYVSQAAGTGTGGSLNALDGSLVGPSAACVGAPPFTSSPCDLTAAVLPGGYTIRVTSRTGVVFILARDAVGTVTRTCDVSAAVGGDSGCRFVVAGGGSW